MADYPLARAGLAALLGGFDDLLVVGQAAGNDAWLAAAAELAPDIVLLDLAADDEEALERLERGLAAREGLAAVVLTAGTERDGEGLAEALAAGARGYLPREAGGEDLAAALRAVGALPRPPPGQRRAPPRMRPRPPAPPASRWGGRSRR